MRPQNNSERFSISEVLLPLLFFSGASLFYAALLIPFTVGITLVVLETLRRQPRPALSTVYIFWIAVCGGLGWFLADIPPYWIWSVYLLVPENIWAPSDAQQTKPFLFGLKKYFKRRVSELVAALIFCVIFSAGVTLLHQKFQGVICWVLALFMLIVCEVIFAVIWRRKK